MNSLRKAAAIFVILLLGCSGDSERTGSSGSRSFNSRDVGETGAWVTRLHTPYVEALSRKNALLAKQEAEIAEAAIQECVGKLVVWPVQVTGISEDSVSICRYTSAYEETWHPFETKIVPSKLGNRGLEVRFFDDDERIRYREKNLLGFEKGEVLKRALVALSIGTEITSEEALSLGKGAWIFIKGRIGVTKVVLGEKPKVIFSIVGCEFHSVGTTGTSDFD